MSELRWEAIGGHWSRVDVGGGASVAYGVAVDGRLWALQPSFRLGLPASGQPPSPVPSSQLIGVPGSCMSDEVVEAVTETERHALLAGFVPWKERGREAPESKACIPSILPS